MLALGMPSNAAPGEPNRPDAIWTPNSARPQESHRGNKRTVAPARFRGYALNDAALEARLDDAPMEGRSAGAVEVAVPAPTGELVTFAVVESPVMESGLAAKYSSIKTYAGRSVDGSGSTIRLDVTAQGFHASVRGNHPSWFVDPAYLGDDSLYLSYLGRDLPEPQQPLVEPELDLDKQAKAKLASRPEGAGGLVQARTYRLALLTDRTYAEYVAPGTNDGLHDPESNEQVLSAKVTLMNRVNHVFGDDMAIKMVLVDDTDKLNLNTAAKGSDANGPCGAQACFTVTQLNFCGGPTLDRTRLVIGQLIGAANYDIGHLGLGRNGGGVAGLGVVGGDGKARGCTGLADPIGDSYAIDYVAHEIGHQFSGLHTFNATCRGGRDAGASVEPGSGSSVMAYAGICGTGDLQPHTDPYFSQRTQTEVFNFVTRAFPNVNEVQSVVFTDFDGTDSFRLRFAGAAGVATTPTIVRGTDYTSADIQAAVQTAVQSAMGLEPAPTVAIAGPVGAAFGDGGFQLSYGGSAAGLDVPNPSVVAVDGTFTSLANDIAKGGAPTNGGYTVTTPGNHNPVVTVPGDRTIPIRTPFALPGSATDPDGDPMVYLWEQNDRGGSTGTDLIANTKVNGPLFRIFGHYADVSSTATLEYNSEGENLADSNPTRVFPDMDQVLAGNTNAATGTCPTPQPSDYKNGANEALVDGPVLECYSEFLPTASYNGDLAASNTEPSLNFRFTARDMGGEAGGTDDGDVKLMIDKTAGPFLVTSQAAPESNGGGGTLPVTWDVAGTAKPSLAENVRITLSTDGGRSFNRVLAGSTPNDGAENITLPYLVTGRARIKVEAVDNYFFDVNDAEFSIEPVFALHSAIPATVAARYSDPVKATLAAVSTYGGALSATAVGLPNGLTLTRTNGTSAGAIPSDATWSVTGTVDDEPGSYPVTITVVNGTRTRTVTFTIAVGPEHATASYTGPSGVLTSTGGDDAVDIEVTAAVMEEADSNPGDLRLATATFVDEVTDEVLCDGVAVSSAGEAVCDFSANLPAGDGGRSYEIGVQLGGRYTGGTPQPGRLVVSVDARAPDTSITRGPRNGSHLLSGSATFEFGSDDVDATYECTLDDAPLACATPSVTVSGLSQKTHRFTVAATDALGNTDPGRESRTFTVPRDVRKLTVVKGKWRLMRHSSAYKGKLLRAKQKGATLRVGFRDAAELAVVVRTGRKAGAFEAFVGDKLVKTVSLKSTRRQRVVVLVHFDRATKGRLKLVTKGKRPVRIEGVAVVTDP